MSIAASMVILIALNANAQYYKIKWTAPNNVEIYNSFYTVKNYNPFDMNNDGISEIITMERIDSNYSCTIYDGATYNLKYHIRSKYTFNGRIYRPFINDNKQVYGFYDIDGDNEKELICAGIDSSSRGNLFINTVTDQVEAYFSGGIRTPDYPPGFSDIDNDGFIEMITLNAVIGHSTTSVAQSSFLSKKSDPLITLYPNPALNSAKIEYYVPSAAYVKIDIFDSSGKLIRTLVNTNKKAGDFMAIWDGKSDDNNKMASGQYYYNVQIGSFSTKKKVILLQ